MVTLKEITEENFGTCTELKVAEEQKTFVASNLYSLAQAWLYPKNARPFAIYDDESMVGFLMIDIDFHWYGDKSTCYLWRLMIDEKHQGKGYGKAAVQLAIQYIGETVNPDKIKTAFVPGNEIAQKLYRSVGFAPNGDIDGDEVVMELGYTAQ